VPDDSESQFPDSPADQAGDTASPSAEAAGAIESTAQDPLEAAQAEQAKLKDQLLRTLADFDNFRKRTRRELGDAERRGREDVLKELLPVFDNLERAAQHAETASDVKALADGLAMVLRHFTDTLCKLGIVRIDSVGQPFDPAVHEAVQHLETSDFAPGVIAAEVQAGYKTGEKLIRPALVVVAKAQPN
jgi:molecular chaperone GrpE